MNKKTLAVESKAKQMENTARILDVNKVKTIEVNDTELTLIIWGLNSLTHSNGGGLSVMSLLDHCTEIADSATLAAKLKAMCK